MTTHDPEFDVVWSGGEGLSTYEGPSPLAALCPRRRSREQVDMSEPPPPVTRGPIPTRICACGCGVTIPPKPWHRRHPASYLAGHHTKGVRFQEARAKAQRNPMALSIAADVALAESLQGRRRARSFSFARLRHGLLRKTA